jgi:SAM-dependent methyltransferase
MAVDLQVNTWDGLGAHVHYPVSLTLAQAEFDHLPLQGQQVDLAIYNSSFHYSEDYVSTLSEALRCLKPGGRIVVLDSPIYRDPTSGSQMVREREQSFEAAYGFRSNALSSENFLTYDRLEELGRTLALRWTVHRPYYGVRWMLRPLIARIRGRREPARFALLVASRGVS